MKFSFFEVIMHAGPDYRMGLLDLGPGALDKIFRFWIDCLYKNGKNCRKNCFSQHIQPSQMKHYQPTLIYMFT